MIRRVLGAGIAVVAVVALGSPPPAYAGCLHFWEICGAPTTTGTVRVRFMIGMCQAEGVATLTGSSTPESICYALRDSLNNDCGSCTFACAESTQTAGCWVVGDSPSCSDCDTASAEQCCGVDLRQAEPDW